MATPIGTYAYNDDGDTENIPDDMTDYLVPCIQGVSLYFIKVRARDAGSATDLVRTMDGHYGCGITVARAQEEDELRSIVDDVAFERPVYTANPNNQRIE